MSRPCRRGIAVVVTAVMLLASCSSGGGGEDETAPAPTTASTVPDDGSGDSPDVDSTDVEGPGGEPDDESEPGSPGPDDGHGPDDPDSGDPEDFVDVRTVDAPWSMTAVNIREGDEFATRVACPPGGSAHRVWGTDTYSDDSSVCTAAVHRGLLTYADGGEVLIEHRPGLESYRGTTRNDVTTLEWDSWPGSFVFIGARGVAIEGDEP